MYLHNLVVVAAFELEKAFPDFENKFAPVPPPLDCPWLQVLLDLVGLGLALGSGSFITKCKSPPHCYNPSLSLKTD